MCILMISKNQYISCRVVYWYILNFIFLIKDSFYFFKKLIDELFSARPLVVCIGKYLYVRYTSHLLFNYYIRKYNKWSKANMVVNYKYYNDFLIVSSK